MLVYYAFDNRSAWWTMSQVVHLPAAYRFDGKEILIRRDMKTGDVFLKQGALRWNRTRLGRA